MAILVKEEHDGRKDVERGTRVNADSLFPEALIFLTPTSLLNPAY